MRSEAQEKALRDLNKNIYFGNEPKLKKIYLTDAQFNEDFGNALTWYVNKTETSQRKKWAIEWMQSSGTYTTKQIRAVDEVPASRFRTSPAGALARIYTLSENDSVLKKLHEKIEELISEGLKLQNRAVPIEKTAKPAKQLELSPIACKIATEIECQIDTGTIKTFDVEKFARDLGCTRKIFQEVVVYNGSKLDMVYQLQSALRGDADFVEAYSHIPDALKQSIIDFRLNLHKVRDMLGVDALPKLERRIDTKKMVAELEYMEKGEIAGRKVKSIDPETIIGKQYLLTYNTAYSKLNLFVAATQDGLQVKKSKISNHDESKSQSKTVKDIETIIAILKADKTKRLDLYNAINKASGRQPSAINKDTLLLLAYTL
jgi:hypothetical protein